MALLHLPVVSPRVLCLSSTFLCRVNHISSTVYYKLKDLADDYNLYLQYSRDDVEKVVHAVSSLQRFRCDSSSFWILNLCSEELAVICFKHGSFYSSFTEHSAHYSLAGRLLSFVDSHRDLGVIVDNKLMFNLNVDSAAQKASSLFGDLLRFTFNRSHNFIVSILYLTFVLY